MSDGTTRYRLDTDPVVLAPVAAQAPVPSAAGLRVALTAPLRAPALGTDVGVDIRDAATGNRLLALDADRGRTPASTAKVLAALAVAQSTDTRARLRTVVVAGPQTETTTDVILVAGGDTLLSPGRGNPTAVAGRAGLADLATDVATALRRTRTTRVRLLVDGSYAAGPAYGPGWTMADVRLGLTGPVAMLGLSTQRPRPGHPASSDPVASTATAFRAALAARGISVTGAVGRGRAGAGAVELGAVESAPLADVLALALAESDNALTEALTRVVAVGQGVRPSFPAVAAWVARQVTAVGVDTRGVRLADTSGLSRATSVPTRVLADALVVAARGDQAAYRRVIAALPVAGLTGTLTERYRSGPARTAAGIVRAKTGTLIGVAALAGTLVDADGRELVFAIVADRAPVGGAERSRAALDNVVAALTACGCP